MRASCARRPIIATQTPPAPDVSVADRVNALLDRLRVWESRQPPAVNSEPDAQDASLAGGLLSAWEEHRDAATRAARSLFNGFRAAREGRIEDAAEEVERALNDAKRIPQVARGADALLRAHISPWDFDRREPGLVVVHSWQELLHPAPDPAALPAAANTQSRPWWQLWRQQPPQQPPVRVRVTSAVKPLYGEWKLSARTKLLERSDGRMLVLGKAGLYLAGNAPPYVGLEADRIVQIPRTPLLAFGNVNYRSSRKPFAPAVVASAGLQFTINAREWNLTLRTGWSTRNNGTLTITPMAANTYF